MWQIAVFSAPVFGGTLGAFTVGKETSYVLAILSTFRHRRLLNRLRSIAFWLVPLVLSGCQSLVSEGQNTEGTRLFQQGNYQAALQRFQQAAASNPNDPDSYYNLASTYHQLGRIESRAEYLKQAENYYNQCLDHAPDHVDCHRNLAVMLAEQGRSTEAFRLLQRWVDGSPTVADARVELARLYEDYGDASQARSQLQSAVAIDPRNSRALAALGRLYEQAGEQAQALAVYERSLGINPVQADLAQRAGALRVALAPRGGVPTPAVPPTRTVTAPTPGLWR